jgi:hypothetical protein
LLANFGSPKPKLNEEKMLAETEPTEEEIRQRYLFIKIGRVFQKALN